ncbi:unnamed protein product [Adineta steineri]|uniref:dihydrolipoyl dehydrogenase n=1 Tax=Adineta steineri TaxID=433720 RepID=A0A818V5W9_9BILA|nr:unnamed protein product [Adineta steineri]CAF3710432.1 unnamed protein product [Adineta steineri]
MTTDVMNTSTFSEDISVDNEKDETVDNLIEEQKQEVESEKYQFDVIVIGSGPGGYTSAIRCAQYGKSVAIIERDLIGGHAVNWGCIPLNSMMTSARLIRSIHESTRYGINITSHRIDFSHITRHRDEAPIQKYTYANVYDTDGRSPYESDDSSIPIRTETEITGQHIIVASGVEYELPKFVEINDKRTVDPTQLLWHRNIPESLIIIGGGVLGCELASLYSHLHSDVILIEKNSRLLKFMDEQVSIAVETRLKEIGVEIILNANIEQVSNGKVIVQLRPTNTNRTVSASYVVVCTGRKPTFNYENLEKLGIAIDYERSTIIINEHTCQTSIPTIYACGGIVSSCWSWVPCAIRQGHLAANTICKIESNINENNRKLYTANNPAIPFVINVIPAVASVGEIPKLTNDVLIYIFKFQSNRRAIIDNQTWGFIKMWTTCDEPKRFLAVQLVHEFAAEIIEYYSMIISLNIPLRDVCLLPFAHPTYTESVKEACEYVLGQSMNYEGTYSN